MIEKPLIVGARGTMGRRYTAVMRKLGIEPLLCDVGDDIPTDFDGVIIATPTAMHASHVQQFLQFRKPILCEKPLATNLKLVESVCAFADAENADLSMVNQYKYLQGERLPYESDLTVYDYFNHGRDGLAWDCISIVALAQEHVVLGEKSPIWECIINGELMSLSDMDHAYMRMIRRWLSGNLRGHGTDYIRDAHQRVQRYIEERKT